MRPPSSTQRPFCHNGRFIAAAKSYEGIRQLARLALQDVAQAVAAN